MNRTSGLNLDDFPDSPYANELRRSIRLRGFALPVEAEYRHTHLERVHLRVRIWFLLSAVLAVLFTFDQLHRAGFANAFSILHVAVLLPCVLVQSWLTWSAHYERRYLTWSPPLLLVFYTLITMFIARSLVEGREEELSALTVNVVGLFFFCGLMFRRAAFICAVTLVVFVVSALADGASIPILVKSAAILLVTAVVSAIVKRDVERSYRRSFLEGALISDLVARDPLSGLMNRRAFDEHLTRIWQHALRDERTIAVLMIDIDHFKTFNDRSGHQAGDVVIRSVARVVQDHARRPLDLAARYGGEEFAVILYDLALPYVQNIAHRLCDGVRNLQVGVGTPLEDARQPLTVSVGVAWVKPALGRTPKGVVQLADEALYEAKRAGRDRVMLKATAEYAQLDTGTFEGPAHQPRRAV